MESYLWFGEVVYLVICLGVTHIIGQVLYKHGLVTVCDMFQDAKLSATVNKLLLTGYYLVNMGYVAISVREMEKADNLQASIEAVSSHTGTLFLILALLHFNNIIVLSLISRYKHKFNSFFNF